MIRVLVVLAALCALASVASAHELRPAYLELRETAPGDYEVLWKTPMVGDARLDLVPEFPAGARATSPVATRRPPGAAVQTWTLRAPGLRGQMLRIRGLDVTMTDTLVRVQHADGTTWTKRLTPQQTKYVSAIQSHPPRSPAAKPNAAGATPKEMMSASESNSRPSTDC